MRICVFRASGDMPLSKMCVETIRYHNPYAEIIHLAGIGTPMIEGADCIARLPCDGTPVGATRTRLDHLCELGNDPAIILDDDILVQQSLDNAFFDEAWDVGLTARKKSTRYNCGVMFHHGTAFWLAVRERMPAFTEDFMILERMIQEEVDTGKWKVNELDCREWNNYWVEKKHWPSGRLVHFKGGRKKWMKGYFDSGIWRKERLAA